MGTEIERKFLPRDDSWRARAEGVRYRQGYLNRASERTVRVRTMASKGFLTIKGISVGPTRAEYEYEIPADDANEMLDTLCEKPLIEKVRFKVEHQGLVWEIDEFVGDNAGLVVAEVELHSADQVIELPAWVGQEVTGDPRYFNSSLVKRPYNTW